MQIQTPPGIKQFYESRFKERYNIAILWVKGVAYKTNTLIYGRGSKMERWSDWVTGRASRPEINFVGLLSEKIG